MRLVSFYSDLLHLPSFLPSAVYLGSAVQVRESSLFLSLLILLGKASRLLSMIATHSDVGSVGGIADRNEISAAERTLTGLTAAGTA